MATRKKTGAKASSTASAGAEKAAEEPDFDTRLARLEALVGELEEGGLGLEQAIERYREGVELLAGARDQLAGYRKQVEELTQGALDALRPYAGDPDADAGNSEQGARGEGGPA